MATIPFTKRLMIITGSHHTKLAEDVAELTYEDNKYAAFTLC